MEKRISKNKRSLLLLVTGLLCTLALGYFIYTSNPHSVFPIPFSPFINPLVIFFILLFLSLSLLGTYLLKNSRRGILLGLFICSCLLLRLNHLTEVYFILILFALFISLELFFTRYH